MRRMFSEKQIETLIQKAIDNGYISLYEDLNVAESIVVIPRAEIEGIDVDFGYCSIRKTREKELYLVLNFSLTNTTESTINVGSYLRFTLTLPEDVAKEIYDVNGKSVNQVSATEAGITSAQVYSDVGSPGAGYYNGYVMTLLNYNEVNKLNMQLRSYTNIAAGATHNFTFRLFLTI